MAEATMPWPVARVAVNVPAAPPATSPVRSPLRVSKPASQGPAAPVVFLFAAGLVAVLLRVAGPLTGLL